ncbi:MAG: HNH endonuclease [Candidatus Wolfebacteria bacterium]|nr:HNH endonuclease [Candidatus Wolfebacteria bacterium]
MENTFGSVAYLRKLNAQELGYRNGQPGKAGRYFLVSKGAVGFFPPLSEIIVNDNVILDIIPPFSDDVVLTKYVYHNDRIAGEGTRDEYRLYLNTDNDPGRNYFKPGDIILIVKILDTENNLTYKILRYAVSSREYTRLDSMIGAASLNRRTESHALIALRELTFLGDLRRVKIGKKIIPKEIISEAFDLPVNHAFVGEEDKEEATRIIRNRSFRDLVMYFYEDRCAITGKNLLIDYRFFSNLEAAHIFSRASGGGSHPSNGIALERNLHWAFDKGFFTLTTDYKVDVHPKVMTVPYLSSKHGHEIFLPQDDRSKPNKGSIQWHRDNVFGLFLRTEM